MLTVTCWRNVIVSYIFILFFIVLSNRLVEFTSKPVAHSRRLWWFQQTSHPGWVSDRLDLRSSAHSRCRYFCRRLLYKHLIYFRFCWDEFVLLERSMVDLRRKNIFGKYDAGRIFNIIIRWQMGWDAPNTKNQAIISHVITYTTVFKY